MNAPARAPARILGGAAARSDPLLLALTMGVATAATAVHALTGLFWGDLEVYRGTAIAVLEGRSPYDFVNHNGLLFTYPPFAALLFTPLAPLGPYAAIWLWTSLSMASLIAVVWLLLPPRSAAEPGRGARLTLVATLAALPLLPVAQTLGGGQVNLVLMLLIVADLRWVRRRYQGIAIGVAAGIKLTPLIFIPYLALTGRIRAALLATAAFLGTVGVGWILLPGPSATYWSGTFFDSSRLSPPDGQRYADIFNQSLRGTLIRASADAADTGWLPVSLAAGVLGLAVAAWAGRRGLQRAGMLACALTGLLVSPVSWHAHWVWCVPLVMTLAWWGQGGHRLVARLAAAALWLCFAGSSYWLIVFFSGPHRVRPDGWFLPLDSLYVTIGAALLALLAIHLYRTRHAGPSKGDKP